MYSIGIALVYLGLVLIRGVDLIRGVASFQDLYYPAYFGTEV